MLPGIGIDTSHLGGKIQNPCNHEDYQPPVQLSPVQFMIRTLRGTIIHVPPDDIHSVLEYEVKKTPIQISEANTASNTDMNFGR